MLMICTSVLPKQPIWAQHPLRCISGFISGPAHQFVRRFLMAIAALLFAVLGLAMAATSSPSSARTVLDLDSKLQPAQLNDWGDFWLDPTGQHTASQVSSNADGSVNWQPTRNSAVYPLKTSNALWVRFAVPPTPDIERSSLEGRLPAAPAPAARARGDQMAPLSFA